MNGVDKQFIAIDDIPVVARSIRALMDCQLISEIVLVCPARRIADFYDLVKEYDLDLISKVVGGGETRQTSVFAGIEACDDRAGYYVIHDGARPLVTPVEVEACINAAMEHGAAALGTRPKDTLKRTGQEGYITATIDRNEIMAIQTPQVFEAQLYREAMALALREKMDYSDDCQLVERMGKRVYVAPGRYENIKITTAEDVAIAQALLRIRREGIEEWLASDQDGGV